MNTTTYINNMNELLSSYQIHYQNLRSLHWNVRGRAFFELHEKYEELYTRAQEIIDELAERILSIGSTPISRFSEYAKHSTISENEIISNGNEGVSYLLDAQIELIKLEKQLLQASDELDDEGTNSLMSDLIGEKEKSNWMFKSWLDQ